MRTERLRKRYVIDLKYVHFPLHPETPAEGRTLEELFRGRGFDVRAAGERMRKLMEEEGLPYGERTMTYNSRLAQELGAWATGKPGGEAIHDALFSAYFVDGRNLAVVDTLVATAEGVGLPEEEAREVLEARTYEAEVDADWRRSRELGITGVPTFVAGGRFVVGAQPYDVLERLVLSAGAQTRT